MLAETRVEWTSPAALWDQCNGAATEPQRRIFRTPAILRFASDSYMQDLLGVMRTDPHSIRDRLAVPETWSSRVPDAAPVRAKRGVFGTLERARVAAQRRLEARQAGSMRSDSWNASGERPLKLFHPAAQRYYVVTASLVCRTLGLPDRPVRTSAQERVSFVMRMLDTAEGVVNPDPTGCHELGFVDGTWQEAANPEALLAGEEQHLMSPLYYLEDDGRRRRMYNGIIPVARREALVGAPTTQGPPAEVIDPRQMMLKQQVLGPWASLEDVAARAQGEAETLPDTDTSPDAQGARDRANEQLQNVSWFILLDLSQWLYDNLRPVWNAVQSTDGSSGPSDPLQKAAYDALDLTLQGHSLLVALSDIETYRSELEGAKRPYGANLTDTTGTAYTTDKGWPPTFQFVTATADGVDPEKGRKTRESVETALTAALSAAVPTSVPVPTISSINAMGHVSPWFTVRCVYERPNCAQLAPPLLSEPSASFQLASFFDPDAPARPIRVELPVDTTPAGLRKFDKNTAFVMSDVLCGQVSKLRSLSFGDLVRSVLPWPLHKDLEVGSITSCVDRKTGATAGMVCSLSIPIVTICALLLLMIIVKLLDFVFQWLPFFMICLPVPKFDSKGGS
jgi:hypothetical protein